MGFFNIIISVALILTSVIKGVKIQDQYIVTFKQDPLFTFENQIETLNRVLADYGPPNKIYHIYDTVLKGASISANANALKSVISLPYIKRIEPNQEVSLFYVSQANATWSLARVSQRVKLGAEPYTYNYNPNAGDGVTVYVVDTGVNISHQDFEGRAVWGITTAKDAVSEDKNGHGTHCAGTVGGKEYGVAKKAQIVAVKVMQDSGSGSTDDIIAGLNWVLKDKRGPKGKVISMSLGGLALFSESLEEAANNAVTSGVVFVVAAGNDSNNACMYSPGRIPSTITVGATDINDMRAYFSNHGQCVDIFAPGHQIKSAGIGSNTAFAIKSGTSMACPHVAGLAATYLSEGVPSSKINATLAELATKDALMLTLPFSPNLIGYNGYTSHLYIL